LADLLEALVAGPGDPVEQAPQPGVVGLVGEDRIVGALVHQVGGDDHGVGQQRHGQELAPYWGEYQQGQAAAVAQGDIGQGQQIRP